MNTQMRFIVALSILGALGSGWLAWRTIMHSTATVPVEIVKIDLGAVSAVVTSIGTAHLRSCKEARLHSALDGKVSSVRARIGQAVLAGDLLVELVSDAPRGELEHAHHDLIAARQEARASCVETVDRRRPPRRLEGRRRQAVNDAAAENDVDTNADRMNTGEAACVSAAAEEKSALARWQAALAELAQTRLRAPMSGLVSEVDVRVGDVLSVAAHGSPRPLVSIIDPQCLILQAAFAHHAAKYVSGGMSACYPSASTAERKLCNGMVSRIEQAQEHGSSGEEAAAMIDIRLPPSAWSDVMASETNKERLVVSVPLPADTQIVRLPRRALVAGDEVLLFNERTGRVTKRRVVLGIGDEHYVEVLQGLEPGDQVAVPSRGDAAASDARIERIVAP